MTSQTNLTGESPAWRSFIDLRQEKAEYYYRTILQDQHKWYSDKAGLQKKRHQFFAIAVIVLGACITLLQVFDINDQIKYLTAVLGALVSIIRALDTFLRPGETWQGYRKASESMKRELRLYINNSGAYKDLPDETSAYQLFVEQVEIIIAEEQQIYWQAHSKIQDHEQNTAPENDRALT